jgi:glycine/D-amino acid oxidase-like deaminating enzyme
LSAGEAIVIGAGIVGAATAAALAHEGMRVTILDARFAAGGTTAAGMGHLVAMDDSPAQLALTAYSNALWRSLAPELPASSEYDPCGTLWVAENDEQLAAVAEKRATYAASGIDAEVVEATRVAALEPNLRPGLAGALRVPGDSVLYPPAATLALLDRARGGGARLREHCVVKSVSEHAVTTDDATLRADVIVNAAGAEAGRLTPELPIVPRKGHLVITDRSPGFCRHQIVELGYLASAHRMTDASVAFNIQPRKTGQMLIGSSRELVGWNAEVNPAILRRMLSRAVEFLPGLSRLNAIRTWTGFRPATPDKLPLIGRWPAVPGLWIAAGHEGLGIATSLGTAALLSDLIVGRTTAIDASPFDPSRASARSTPEDHASRNA